MGKDFTELEIYQLAENLIIKIYKVSHGFPKEEIYGIISQLRRAAVSIALNIAEGCGRYHFKDKVIFLYNARGSLFETKSAVLISYRPGFVTEEDKRDFVFKLDDLGIRLNNYISYLRKK